MNTEKKDSVSVFISVDLWPLLLFPVFVGRVDYASTVADGRVDKLKRAAKVVERGDGNQAAQHTAREVVEHDFHIGSVGRQRFSPSFLARFPSHIPRPFKRGGAVRTLHLGAEHN